MKTNPSVLCCLLAVVAAAGAAAHPLSAQEPSSEARRIAQARLERIPNADLGNGYYRNPVMVGPGSDNSVVRVGSDFYLIAGGGGFPDQLVWHSRDLVNWRPLTRALTTPGRVWASDIAFHDGRFYIYTTFNDPSKRRPENRGLTGAQVSILGTSSKDTGEPSFDNIVITADRPEGPWSKPAHIGVLGLFDPGHIATPDGRRFLFFNRGMMIELTRDGTSTIGDVKQVYEGWQYPADWVLECHCLEAPKLLFRDGWYYMASAEGGTGGPATAHMGVIARARSLAGPWENSPYNPIVRTQSREEKWWRQGHGTIIDDVAGNWWFMYTGYASDATYLGKQSMLLPIEWTADGWPRVPAGVNATDVLRKPAGENVGHGMPLSDDFSANTIGIQWTWGAEANPAELFKVGGGELRMKAAGTGPATATTLSVGAPNRAYEVDVDVEIGERSEGGIMIGTVNAGLRKGEAFGYWPSIPNALPWAKNRISIRIRNDRGDISFFWSSDGSNWRRFPNGGAVTSPRSLSLYAAGEGDVVFRNFRYRGLD
jgi:beta-xylosidase